MLVSFICCKDPLDETTVGDVAVSKEKEEEISCIRHLLNLSSLFLVPKILIAIQYSNLKIHQSTR